MNRPFHLAVIALLSCMGCESSPQRVMAQEPTAARVEPAAPSPSQAQPASIRERPTHPSCAATGQRANDQAASKGDAAADPQGTRTITGYVVQTTPQVVLDVEKPMAFFLADMGSEDIDALQFGRFVEVDYHTEFVAGEELGARFIISAVRPSNAARFPSVAFEYQPQGARKLTIYHDGSARYGFEPLVLGADDMNRIMVALGAAGVDQMADEGWSMTLTCARRQQLPLDADSLGPVRELIAEVLAKALGSLEYRLQYAWSFPSPVPWTLPRTDLATRVAGRSRGRSSYDPAVPAKLGKQIAERNRPSPKRASVFEQNGVLYRVEQSTVRAVTFDTLAVHDCNATGPFCYLLPADVDLGAAPPAGVLLSSSQLAAMALKAETGESPLFGWAVGGGKVYGGLTLVRRKSGATTTNWQVKFSGGSEPLLKWPKGAPPLKNYLRERGDARNDDDRKHPLFRRYGASVAKHLAASKPKRGMPGTLAPAFVLDRGVVYQIFDNCPAENLPCAKGTFFALSAKRIHAVVWPSWAVNLSTKDENVPLTAAHYAEHMRFYDTIRRTSGGVGAIRGTELLRFITITER